MHNSDRIIRTGIADRPLWLRVGLACGILRMLGVDGKSHAAALERGLAHIGRPAIWWFDPLPHADGDPWHITIVWVAGS